MMLSYQAMKGGVYADGYDSMVNSTGALYTGLPGGATGSLSTSLLASTTLTAQQVARLAKIGITTVQTMKDDATVGFGATMFAYSTTGFTYSNPQTISTTTKLPFLVLSGAGAYTLGGMKFNLDATHAYVVLAVGQACSLVGPNGWIKEAPVIRHSDGCVDPEKAYCRAAVIFDLGAPVAGRDTFLPKYVGAIALGATSFKFSEELINVPERML